MSTCGGGRALLALALVAAPALAAGPAAAPTDDPRLAELERLDEEGRWAEAEQAARTLLAQVERESGTDSIEVVRVLDHLVAALRRGGREGEPEATALAQRAIDIGERLLGPDDPVVAGSLRQLGDLERVNGHPVEALGHLERARAILERAKLTESRAMAATLNGLGSAAADLGDFPQARRYYESALAVYRKVGAVHWVALASSNLATILEELAEFDAAIDRYREALPILESESGPEHPDVAIVVDNMGNVYQDIGDYEQARVLHERALRIREKTLGPDHRLTGATLMNLGCTLREMGKPADAVPLLERALRVIEAGRGPDHPLVAMAQLSLADAYIDLGRLDAARPLAQRALDVREKRFGSDHAVVARSRIQMSRLEAAEGRRGPALSQALQATDIVRRVVLRVAPALTEGEALSLATTLSSGLDAAVASLAAGRERVTARDAERVWDAVARSRALVLDEMARRHRAVVDSDRPEVARLAADLDGARQELARLLVGGPQVTGLDEFRKALSAARNVVDRAERALAEASVSYRAERRRLDSGIDDVLRDLPAGSAIVGYAAAAGRYLAFVGAAGKGGVRRFDLGARADVDGLVDAWQAQVGAAPRDAAAVDAYRRAGTALRRAVWDPLAPALGAAGRVFVVPDGALHRVSFAALPVGADRYLVEELPVLHYLSAERDLIAADRDGSASDARNVAGGLFIVGGPDFDGRPENPAPTTVASSARATRSAAPYRGELPTCDSFHALRFAPLPGARAEADEIAAMWREADRLEGRSRGEVVELTARGAGEAEVKAHAGGHAVVHLATHTFSIGGPCSAKGPAPATAPILAATRGPTGTPAPPGRALLLTGLALAGANRRGEIADPTRQEDGVLTADEAAALDLRGVEWVVLSACQSGLGPVRRGEGVLGLRRAFQVAGAGTVILTLWPVSDQDTRDWMRELYAARLGGDDTPEAMRNASLRVLDARRNAHVSTHPFFWGAFVAAGDWH